jgi:hypothetical protein
LRFEILDLKSVHYSLDEIADWGFFVMDEVAGSNSIGGDDDFGVESGTKEIDGDNRSSTEIPVGLDRLAEQHFATLERGMRMAAHGVADDLGGDHWIAE